MVRSKSGEIDPELEAELAEAAAAVGCELAFLEWKGGTLRLAIDRPEGVTLADCERVSKQASALLDVLDFGAGRYTLEVSSPGLDRPLTKPRDWERFVGRKVRVTYSNAEVRKRTVVARLESFDPEHQTASLLEEEGGERIVLPLNQIKSARLEIEI